MKKIIVIENNEIFGERLVDQLEKSGFDAKLAPDGEGGLNLIRSEKTDLVIMDPVLPQKNGFEVLEKIKKSPDSKKIPVVILTLLDKDSDVKKGLQLGAHDYLIKSQHTIKEVVEKIQYILAEEYGPTPTG